MKKKHKIILVAGLVLSTILALLASLLAFSAKWMFKTWTNLTMDELVYHLTAPLEGTNTDMIKDYCNECAVPAILILGCILFVIAANRNHAGILKKIAIVCSAGSCCSDRNYSRCSMEWIRCFELYEGAEYIFYIY